MNKVSKRLKILLGFLIISCVVSAQNSKPTFTFDKTEHDYGTISENGGLANHTFTITNTGSDALTIRQVVASCGCTKPDWTTNPIDPGKSGEIKVSYDPNGRPGLFQKTITVYVVDADPVALTIKGVVGNKVEDTIKAPVLTFDELAHNFGTIGENDGPADHTFYFTNTGTAPLVISRVQASCGCTKPEWSREPVLPGQRGFVLVSYNPVGRIGVFNKTATVYTNETTGVKSHRLSIKGDVVERPSDPPVTAYADTIGGVGVQFTDLSFSDLYQLGINSHTMYIKNCNEQTAYLTFENVPDYVTIKHPDSLKAEWPGQMSVMIDDAKAKNKRGRVIESYKLVIRDRDGAVLGSGNITTRVNYLDDFNSLTPLQKISLPAIEITNSKLEFGTVKKGLFGLFGGSAKKQFILTNKGKSDLILHSVSSDDSRVHLNIPAGTKIAAGASLTVDVTVNAKELVDKAVDTDIYIVCNDPKGPVRLVKVTAQKAE